MQQRYHNVDEIKKSILHDNLTHNIHEQALKAQRRIIQRQQQREQEHLINERVQTELIQEKQKYINQKSYVRSLLSFEYDRHIMHKKKVKEMEKMRDRSYAEMQQQFQDEFMEKRARDLARIYRKQRNSMVANPEMSNRSHVLPSPLHYQATPTSRNEKKIATEISNDKTEPLQYKEYLTEQIAKRQHNKQKQLSETRQKERVQSLYNNEALERQINQQREHQMMQKLRFKQQLDQQIDEKKRFKTAI